MASKAANQNLTDFFEMWGFFEPVNTTIEQYGTYKYYVSDAMIREAKEYMAQFPAPNMLSNTLKTERKVSFHRMTTAIRQSEMSDITLNSKKIRR